VDFTSSLSQAFGGAPSPEAARPKNLRELLSSFQQAPAGSPEFHRSLIGWVVHFSQFVEGVLASNLRDLGRTRGMLEALTADQSDIYADVLSVLKASSQAVERRDWTTLGEQNQQFAGLLEELSGNLEDLSEWKKANFHRCLQCGYSAPDQSIGRCPECSVSLLRPPKKLVVTTSSRALDGAESGLYSAIQDILAGRKDVTAVTPFVEELLDFYSTCLIEIGTPDPEYEEDLELEEGLQSSIEALYQMGDTLKDFDAQNLVDGWQLFYLSSGTVEQLMEYDEQPAFKSNPQTVDQVILSGEDD
jgi:predicted Zn-ribbon and HTH transcriptional regulator